MTDLTYFADLQRLRVIHGKTGPNYDAYAHTKTVRNAETYEWEKVLNENFDPISQCNNNFKGNTPIDTTGLKCCGDYPDRTLYNPLDKTTQCCVYSATDLFTSTTTINDYFTNYVDMKQTYGYNFPKNIGQIYNPNEQSCTESGVSG